MRKFVAVILAVVLAACSNSADKKAAEQAVVDFHEMLDASQFDAIYVGSAQDMKNAVKQEEFVTFLQAVHKKLGNLKSTVPQGWRINYQTSGTFVALGYETHFAEGDATEEFTYRVDSNKATLVGYHVNSMALITK